MTEKEKMLSGKLYDPSAPELVERRHFAHRLSKDYNDTYDDEDEKRADIMKKLVPNFGADSYLQGPIQFDYGYNTSFGKRCYANFNLTVLDCANVTVGNDVFIGPNCTLATAVHPVLPKERNTRKNEKGVDYPPEYARPIIIEDDCWLASNVTVCGGVTVGKGSVIGAGSVVVKDIPCGVFAAGNPCRVIRPLTEADSVNLKKELF